MCVVAGLAGSVVLASPVAGFAASVPTDEIAPSKPLGAVNSILIFGVGPVALLLILTAIFLRPGSAPGSQRYRPGRGWNADPTWIGVPAREHHSEHALAGADTLEAEADEFSHREHPPQIEPDSSETSNPRHGGAHGSW